MQSNNMQSTNFNIINGKIWELCNPHKMGYMMKYFEEFKQLSFNLSKEEKLTLCKDFEVVVRDHYPSRKYVFDTIFNEECTDDEFIEYLSELNIQSGISKMFFVIKKVNDHFKE